MTEQDPIVNESAANKAAESGDATRKSAGHKDGPTVIVNTVAEKKGNGLGTAGFVLALLGLLVSWAPVAGWIVWLLGAVLSVAGLRRTPRGLAIAGTVLSFIDVIILVSVAGMIGALL